MRIDDVVTVFLEKDGKVLILRRSDEVKSFKGKWAGISGYIERGEHPLLAAYREVYEELGVEKGLLLPLSYGDYFVVNDRWRVHPFLFRLKKNFNFNLNWENVEYKWISPNEVFDYDRVPKLEESLERAYLYSFLSLEKELQEKIIKVLEDRNSGLSGVARNMVHLLSRIKAPLSLAKDVSKIALVLRTDLPALYNTILFLYENGLGAYEEEIRRISYDFGVFIRENGIRNLLTISNSSTVLEILKANSNFIDNIYVLSSGPRNEGIEFAKRLYKEGIRVSLLSDFGFSLIDYDAFVFGTDGIYKGLGFFINKIGTKAICLYNRYYKKKNVLVADRSKLLDKYMFLEIEKPKEEICKCENDGGLDIINFYFEEIPLELVDHGFM